jgi:Lrp/AsnC family leucine-responsive transcriptional regulator
MRVAETDKIILELLRQDSRRTISEIATAVGLSRPTVRARIERMHRAGIIRRFTIDISAEDVLAPTALRAIFDLRLRRSVCHLVYASISSWPELIACWSTLGAVDMRILVEACSQTEIERLRDRVARHLEVSLLQTSMVLRTWTERISPGEGGVIAEQSQFRLEDA